MDLVCDSDGFMVAYLVFKYFLLSGAAWNFNPASSYIYKSSIIEFQQNANFSP